MDFLFELLCGLLHLILNALLELAGELFMDLITRALAEVIWPPEVSSPLLGCLGYLLLGALIGVVSLHYFPHPLVHPSRFHGVSVLVSPVLVGLAMSAVGSSLRKREKEVVQIENFGYGFTFAFGMALIRFFFVR